MKNFYFLLLVSVFANAQIINFPNAAFKNRLLSASATNSIASDDVNDSMLPQDYTFNKIDTNNDGEIQISEAAVIT